MVDAVFKEKAFKALNASPKYGPDVDLSKYVNLSGEGMEKEDGIKEEVIGHIAEKIGFGGGAWRRAGYVQVNEEILTAEMRKGLEKAGASVLPTYEALRKIKRLKEYSWKLLLPYKDKFTAVTYLYGKEQGYFIYVPPGVKVKDPIYTCLFITKGQYAQLLHNIVIVDDDAELNLITGCGISDIPAGALHAGISEFYVGRGAKLTFAMIHAWSPRAVVRPRTAVHVKENGEYVSYYMIYSGIDSIQAYPEVFLERNASAYLYSVVVGEGNGIYDLGASAVLRGEGANAEIVSRVIGRYRSKVIARARLVGEEGPSKGHIECMGLAEGEKSEVSSVPELISRTPEAILTHEAAIGKISREELMYLMSKGFSEDEARALILRGFITLPTPHLPQTVRETIGRIVKYVSSRAHG